MNRRLLLLAIPLLLLAAGLTIACGDGNDSPNPTGNGADGTAEPFEVARDALIEDLENIGSTIGDVPSDVGAGLLTDCRQLRLFADRDRVDGICEAIRQAMENRDPGLIDRVLEELAALTPD